MATLWPLQPRRDGNIRAWAPRWLRPPHGIDHGGDFAASPEQQLRWLCDLGPVYLRTRPSLARALALTVAENPDLRPTLRGILTQGEMVTQDHRRLCRKYLGRDLIDSYGLAEAGTIALRCPISDLYHIQSETCLVELLKPDMRPCKPGELGEIVVTALYNFAMPLLRYATGDFAELAYSAETDGRCACGRTLPALKRVFGRAQNLLPCSRIRHCRRRWIGGSCSNISERVRGSSGRSGRANLRCTMFRSGLRIARIAIL